MMNPVDASSSAWWPGVSGSLGGCGFTEVVYRPCLPDQSTTPDPGRDGCSRQSSFGGLIGASYAHGAALRSKEQGTTGLLHPKGQISALLAAP